MGEVHLEVYSVQVFTLISGERMLLKIDNIIELEIILCFDCEFRTRLQSFSAYCKRHAGAFVLDASSGIYI